MAVDWNSLLQSALKAAETSLGNVWTVAAQGAAGAITSLVNTAQYVEANKASMTTDEYNFLLAQHKITLQNVLQGYAAISYAGAQNAVAAVVNTLVAAIPGLAAGLI
jgi:hypothetical protein